MVVRKFISISTIRFIVIQCICSHNKNFLSFYNSIFSLLDVLFLSQQLNFLLALKLSYTKKPLSSHLPRKISSLSHLPLPLLHFAFSFPEQIEFC